MYRIELAPGEETALRTIDELATGIRNGVITSRARIWHNAGQMWLPIQVHPHYQAALKQLKEDSSPTLAAAPLPAVAAAPSPVVPPAVPTPKEERQESTSPPILSAEPPSQEPAEAARPARAGNSDRPRSVLRPIGLVAGGLALIVGARMVASATAADESPSTVARMAATVASPNPREATAPNSAARAAEPTSRPAPASTTVASNSTREADADIAASAPAPAAEPPKRAFDGGVVRGPDATTLAPPPPRRESREDDEELPPIAPAPVVTGVPIPAIPLDTLR